MVIIQFLGMLLVQRSSLVGLFNVLRIPGLTQTMISY